MVNINEGSTVALEEVYFDPEIFFLPFLPLDSFLRF